MTGFFNSLGKYPDEIAEKKLHPECVHIQSLIKSALNTLQESSDKKNIIAGVSSGYCDLDTMTDGFRPGNLIVIAARPSMGKTTLAYNIAQNVSVEPKDQTPTALFTLESTKEDVVIEFLSAVSGVDIERVCKGNFYDSDWPKLTKAAGLLHNSKLWIDDTPSISVLELRLKALRLKKEYGIGLIIIDYLQLMRAGADLNSEQQEIPYISAALKALAKELKIPVIVFAHLDRILENHRDQRPVVSDMGSLGAIEQDADVIVFIHRDSMYCEKCQINACDKDHKHDAELIIAKQRRGRTGTVFLDYFSERRRFENITPLVTYEK